MQTEATRRDRARGGLHPGDEPLVARGVVDAAAARDEQRVDPAAAAVERAIGMERDAGRASGPGSAATTSTAYSVASDSCAAVVKTSAGPCTSRVWTAGKAAMTTRRIRTCCRAARAWRQGHVPDDFCQPA